ncbi:MAG: SsrA-binding protein SmpB [Trueperaceae bacterium]|jgi:SsrA-binding protein|nr:SsrA-binding protein SmpB [Truepera sp.]HRN17985.1 SsrA-binding protein SmpB [Trueperaceae bacterium]HRQ10407.1 SsrA-binding protein SmpB [Trueperaceae bacterium]
MLRNRRATHDYELLETFEAGLELTGSEVKSLRQGGGSIAEAYAKVMNGQVFVEGMTIPVYQEASYNNHEPTRTRRLLLNAREIDEIAKGLERRGLTLVPLKLYFKGGWAKLEVALARGKKLHDKRSDAAKKDAQREMERELARGGRK